MNPDFVRILIIALLFIFALITVIIVLINVARKKTIEKMYNEIENILHSLINFDSNDDYSIKKNDNSIYDYSFDTPRVTFFIKIIPNFFNEEICINNSVKWQLRRSFNDESLRFVEEVDGLMRMEINSNKKFKKVYIIYPNARSLLKYINECEMVFVHPKTDVYGANIIPYVLLKDNPNLLKEIGEI